ncbi:MAG: alpha/beta fold hydrolase [Moraxella sp.]|nr:alpha/beta fold hydrolase [Moraxella sp.]
MKSIFKYFGIMLLAVLIVLCCGYLYLISQQTKQGDITWQSCYRPSYLFSWFVLPPALRLQCATVSVPVDYAKPDGKTFSIPLTRLPATGDDIIGDLLLLNGGPGGHSLDMSSLMLDNHYGNQVKERFHILGYAPRGIAPSSPAIDCGGIEETDETGKSNAKAYMQACIKHTGADILPFVSSKEVVKDLDSIRKALHNDTWSMVGYSYGTKLVAKYAEHYPSHLRAGVADGVVDTAEDLPTILANQNKHAQIAFERFMDWCQDCAFDRQKDPNAAFLAVLTAIDNQRLKDSDGETIDKQSLLSIFTDSLNDESAWQDLKQMFDELLAGKTDIYNEHRFIAKLNEKGFSNDGLAMINCADSAPKMSKNDYIKHAKSVDAQARYDDIKERADDDYLDSCYYWGHQATDDLAENLVNENTPNLLFVSYEFDLATPYANAQTMAAKFDDPLIVLAGQQGHTVSLFGENACADEYVSRYLFEPKTDFGDKLLICGK